MASRRRARNDMRVVSSINVTPLVDLCLLLLIVFMVVAPALEYALHVQAPALNSKRMGPKPQKMVNLDQDGKIIVENRTVDENGLRAFLADAFRREPELEVFVRADESRPYREVMAIMRVAHDLGIANVSLVTRPEEK